MTRSEFLARLLLATALLLIAGIPLFFWARTPRLLARIAEDGGWTPDAIQARSGEPIHLRLTSGDVVHGFAVGQMDMEPVNVEPGKVSEVTLTFDRPGTYTFYCTRWCGANHWRMRGTIEISGPALDPEPSSTPLYAALGIDLDAPHESPVIPIERPSALRGQPLARSLTSDIASDDYRTCSPYDVFTELAEASMTDQQRWDVVASIWHSNTTSERFENGRTLYAQNCAACHGESGDGNGVFADDLMKAGEVSRQMMAGSQMMNRQTPADFTDPKQMLGASHALLQGKILRGGMGTGMPMWGSIFTDGQMWDLVTYLYSFQFDDH